MSCTTKRNAKRLRELLDAFEEGVLLLHYEEFCALIKQIRKREWDLIVVDEAHRAKDRASLFSRELAKMRHHICYKLLLTGTPIEDEPQDMWGQMRFLNEDVFGSWKGFDEEYLEQPNFSLDDRKPDGSLKYPPGSVRWRRALIKLRIAKRKLKFRKDKIPKFIKLLKPYCWREELPGPDPRFHIIKVPMFGRQLEVYEQYRKHGFVNLNEVTEVRSEIQISKRIKMRQITSGFLFDEDKNVHWVGCAKIRRLMNMIKKGTIKPPVPVFALYTPEIGELERLLPGRHRTLAGHVSREDRLKAQELFQGGKLDWIICQTRTGGVGIDLYRAKALVVLSGNYSSIDFDQLISRIRLPEQNEPVDIFLFIVPDTIDEERQAVVFRKDRKVKPIINQLRRRE